MSSTIAEPGAFGRVSSSAPEPAAEAPSWQPRADLLAAANAAAAHAERVAHARTDLEQTRRSILGRKR